mmetsp:Transcript_31029/g.38329  ORF Transcript_31029/g.38329 Transcript_31029/m.38329 type:complete len:89 (-) Transcript_31029:1154-1420(-)
MKSPKYGICFLNMVGPPFFKAALVLILTNREKILQSDFEQAFELIRDAPANPPKDFATLTASHQLSDEHTELIKKIVREGGNSLIDLS